MHRPAFGTLVVTVLALAFMGAPSLGHGQDSGPDFRQGLRPSQVPQPAPYAWARRTGQTSQAPAIQPVSSRAQVIPRGGYQINPIGQAQASTPLKGQPQGLTPASAFYAGPAPRPIPFGYHPQPTPAQAAPSQPVVSPVYSEAPAPAAQTDQAQISAPRPQPHPEQGTAYPSEPVQAPAPTRAAIEAPEAQRPEQDPFAPRRDAPIFRMAQQPAPTPTPAPNAASSAAPAPYGQSRYYSVHRQYGRQPDPAPQTSPVYLDALPVEVTGMAGSADLAEPPAPPNLIRNANGRIQAMPDLNDID